MKVAVTGADGFIGSHLVEALVRAGADVVAMAQYNSVGSWGWLEDLPADVLDGVEVRLGDLRDAGTTSSALAGASVVYHLGALIAVPYSFDAPRSYVETNVLGTQNVLEAVRRESSRLVHTSTSEVYGSALSVPISEDHPLQAQSPYAATKIAADKLVESYVAAYGVRAVTVRPFNTYGPRQSARAFIPAVMAQALAGRTTVRVGSLSPRRDLTFVADTVAAFQAVGELDDDPWNGATFNAGTGSSWSMGHVLHEIARVVGVHLDVDTDAERVRPPAAEVRHLECDASRLRAATGWEARSSLREGLEATRAWMAEPRHFGSYKPDLHQV
ncbi:GDP-mannose 4,6-dehydratase [Isoptericola sp. b515]|uniref:GDP-mannose 4,6-dehydratase n=1 Tax=Isoptericola sp. b515 TaxID=3064652 RepID=UPI0027134968|nr:GDP-mannose 4,6-dehydratase [Isoptericola sp. b515]MDO8147734.1 GDP-mannose 4,6-dehydratase [Isoptericola sp. b515]